MPSKEFQIRITADSTSFAAPVQQAVNTLNTAAVTTQRQGVLLGGKLSHGMLRGFRGQLHHWMYLGTLLSGIVGGAFGAGIDRSLKGSLKEAFHGALGGGFAGAMFGLGPYGMLAGAGIGAITSVISHNLEKAAEITRAMQLATRKAMAGLSPGTFLRSARGVAGGMPIGESVANIIKKGGREAAEIVETIDKDFKGNFELFIASLSKPMTTTKLEAAIDKAREYLATQQQIVEWQKEENQANDEFVKLREESLTPSEKLLHLQQRLNETIKDIPFQAHDPGSWLNQMSEAIRLQTQLNESAKVTFPAPGNFARAGLFLTGGSVPPQISQAMNVMQQIVSRINAVVDAQRETTRTIEKQ